MFNKHWHWITALLSLLDSSIIWRYHMFSLLWWRSSDIISLNLVDLDRATISPGTGFLNRQQISHYDSTSVLFLPISVSNNLADFMSLFIFSILAYPNCFCILIVLPVGHQRNLFPCAQFLKVAVISWWVTISTAMTTGWLMEIIAFSLCKSVTVYKFQHIKFRFFQHLYSVVLYFLPQNYLSHPLTNLRLGYYVGNHLPNAFLNCIQNIVTFDHFY